MLFRSKQENVGESWEISGVPGNESIVADGEIQANGRKMLKLTCLEQKVEMYKKMGYKDEGISASVWGDEEWHEMSYAF